MRSGNQLTVTKAWRFKECSWSGFQGEKANKQLCSSRFVLTVIKREKKKKENKEIKKTSECLSLLSVFGAGCWYPSLGFLE